jgi:hypothetical protein
MPISSGRTLPASANARPHQGTCVPAPSWCKRSELWRSGVGCELLLVPTLFGNPSQLFN